MNCLPPCNIVLSIALVYHSLALSDTPERNLNLLLLIERTLPLPEIVVCKYGTVPILTGKAIAPLTGRLNIIGNDLCKKFHNNTLHYKLTLILAK